MQIMKIGSNQATTQNNSANNKKQPAFEAIYVDLNSDACKNIPSNKLNAFLDAKNIAGKVLDVYGRAVDAAGNLVKSFTNNEQVSKRTADIVIGQ